ncbi:MAG: DUF938 domain-containing protein [Rhodospirillales bacterium]|nr:DUF938 domain-containing protein [Rhodospirillales bacterium]MBT4040393.1 DUF938 domain-containing protein [Rhodospirillales bacterium]MBT4627290.1 DUF938 domain-containing protein [Rhodospirillales bacterium]MBT5351253.1 DUF938 domain-containing protein [Rhodospirillales bacterium]MBT5520090.1 DUF938 domain-containing protein [Rhodospirillales bacterium]
MDTASRRHSPSTQRNRDIILSVLKDVLPDTGTVLEIASGAGEHAAYFAPHFPTLTWQPTDIDRDNFGSILSWASDTGGAVLDPVHLDTQGNPWPVEAAAAIMCMNMIHISPWASTEGLIQGAGRILGAGGVLFLYGPYKQDGVALAPSNGSFDEWLKNQNPKWGIRELGHVEILATANGLKLDHIVDMPANNLSLIFRKEA